MTAFNARLMAMALMALLLATAECVSERLDLLTVREAQSIVEKIPMVSASKRNGECPSLSVGYVNGDYWVQVRRQCGPGGGSLIGNFVVNRRTGAVTLWGDNQVPVINPDGEAAAHDLLAQARSRALSAKEVRCLALNAARSLPGWSREGDAITVEPAPSGQDEGMRFIAHRRWKDDPAITNRMLTVMPATPHVRDDETGLEIMSDRLGAVITKILALRHPPSLTPDEAVEVVLQIPSMASRLGAGCILSAGGASFWSDEVIVGTVCGSETADDRVLLAVNIHTGLVTDRVGRVIEGSETASRFARQFLKRKHQRRAALQTELETYCRP